MRRAATLLLVVSTLVLARGAEARVDGTYKGIKNPSNGVLFRNMGPKSNRLKFAVTSVGQYAATVTFTWRDADNIPRTMSVSREESMGVLTSIAANSDIAWSCGGPASGELCGWEWQIE